MPYSYTSPDDLPLAPPRNTTIPALWDEIKHGSKQGRQPKAAAEKPKAEAATQHLGLLIARISHRLTPIPGALDALREAVRTIMPILYPTGAPS